MKKCVPLFAASMCLLLTACAAPAEQEEASGGEAVSTEADEAAIRALMDRWEDGLNAEDTEGLMTLFSENTTHMPPDEPAVAGQEAVRAWFDGLFAPEGTIQFDIQTGEIKVGGDWAAARGTYASEVPSDEGEATSGTGKWIVLYERGADGSWRAFATIWNLDAPSTSSV